MSLLRTSPWFQSHSQLSSWGGMLTLPMGTTALWTLTFGSLVKMDHSGGYNLLVIITLSCWLECNWLHWRSTHTVLLPTPFIRLKLVLLSDRNQLWNFMVSMSTMRLMMIRRNTVEHFLQGHSMSFMVYNKETFHQVLKQEYTCMRLTYALLSIAIRPLRYSPHAEINEWIHLGRNIIASQFIRAAHPNVINFHV